MLNAVSLGFLSEAPITAMQIVLAVRLRKGTLTVESPLLPAAQYNLSKLCEL
jgi:hypothetical protein